MFSNRTTIRCSRTIPRDLVLMLTINMDHIMYRVVDLKLCHTVKNVLFSTANKLRNRTLILVLLQ